MYIGYAYVHGHLSGSTQNTLKNKKDNFDFLKGELCNEDCMSKNYCFRHDSISLFGKICLKTIAKMVEIWLVAK